MRKFLILFIGVLFFVSCGNNTNQLPTDVINNPNSAQGVDDGMQLPQISFKKTEHDFGKVIQGEVVTYNFRFTNTGNADLIIAKVSTSCGCTASNYPVDPIKPGETKSIEAKFDSKNRNGFQNNRVTVLSNATPAKTNLYIKADVIKPGQ
jgi:hypothetical protein